MTQPPTVHDYYFGNEAEQYTFYRLPKTLFTEPRYKNLSDSAKILYGLMLDRMGLSIRNGWLDENNRVYIFFTLEDIQENMNCGHNKGVKIMSELDNIGLIERFKQGQGKPAIVYVKKFFSNDRVLYGNKKKDDYREDYPQGNHDFPKAEIQTSENGKSRLPICGSADFRKAECNKNDINNTELNDTEYPSVSLTRQDRTDKTVKMKIYRDLIMDNIEYDVLAAQYGKERLNGIVELMTETVCTSRACVHVNSEEYPAEIVRSRLLSLDSSHIEFVFDRMDDTTTRVRNIRAYMLTALYNAPADMDEFYRAAVNHDLYGKK